ncbi:hypothetical protein DPX16_3686 [Anabarilius grahami]|uniref:Uncharacterized protein n=1 Tax=Anabarilius grahami TaxID=495550 RepID=A0A3N0YIG8_ANAGA|nr:hypothetical protein DPX16_3686 [Anabarilius grahami]
MQCFCQETGVTTADYELPAPPAAGEDELLDDNDVLSLMSSDRGVSALLASSPGKQEMVVEEKAGCSCLGSALREGPHVDGSTSSGPAAPVSLPFLPDLHVEIEKAWKNPYSVRIHRHQWANFADVEGLSQHRYVSMPPIDETFAISSRGEH